jgi:tRNA-dihydrouridine synthase B
MMINAPEVCRILEECGMQTIAVHGRTRAQGYTGEADWDIIDECSQTVNVPIVGNGDINSGADVKKRRDTTGVSGVMIGRSAMQHPWVFRDAKHFLETGEKPEAISAEERWELVLRHAKMLLEWGKFPNEKFAMQSLRSRLMAYSKGLPGGKALRVRFSTVATLSELEDIAADHLKEQQCQRAPREPSMTAPS